MKLITFPFSPSLLGRQEPNLQLNINNFVKLYCLHISVTTFLFSLSSLISTFFLHCIDCIILSCFRYFDLLFPLPIRLCPHTSTRLVPFHHLYLSSHATSSEKPSLILLSKVVPPTVYHITLLCCPRALNTI